ncbi:YceI family protein [Mycolicibacterium sp.]|uniref:YceI family protein n=1 Tax=Mycolicibacterium sp. TaxID=2320850 RepID=UPI0037C9274F
MTNLQDTITATTGTWRLAPDRSKVAFQAKTAWGLATVTGAFTEFSGDGQVTDDVTGRVVIRAASLQTGIGKRDKHLRSADFFDVETHPDIVVEVTGAEPGTTDTAVLHSTFTVRGTSRPVELPVDVRVLEGTAVQVSGHCTVDRAEFGVTGNLLGMVGQKAALSATLVFVRA